MVYYLEQHGLRRKLRAVQIKVKFEEAVQIGRKIALKVIKCPVFTQNFNPR